jgi:hypothetical protein
MRRLHWSLLVLVGWTLLIWLSRIRNIWADEALSTGGQLARTGVAVLFVVLAAVAALRPALVPVFALWTAGYWAVRGVQIILNDHGLGFTVVHTVLALVSIGLAAWVLRTHGLPRRVPV